MSARGACLWLDTSAEPPFSGSLGVLGFYFKKALKELGHGLHCPALAEPTASGRLLPFASAEATRLARSRPADELQIFFDRTLEYVLPTDNPSRPSVVVFHGLRYAAPFFLRGSGLSGYCANSNYLRRVLLSLLLTPDPTGPHGWTFAGDAWVGHVDLVLPIIDFPDGYPSTGAGEEALLAQVGQRDILAHAIRPGKVHPEALASILGLLNTDPLHERLGAPVRLLVADADLASIARAGQRIFGDERVRDRLLPVPVLRNTAVVALMRRCHFGLLYDWLPESFGFYPLESVYSGTPIYSNGLGNVRHLLPEGMGICIMAPEPPALTPPRAPESPGGPAASYARIAERIAQDIASGEARRQCAGGRAWIEAHHRYDVFLASLGRYLTAFERREQANAVAAGELPIGLGPILRDLRPERGLARTDRGDLRLSPAELALIDGVVGQPYGSALPGLDGSARSTLQRLFSSGVLSLERAVPEAGVRLRLSL